MNLDELTTFLRYRDEVRGQVDILVDEPPLDLRMVGDAGYASKEVARDIMRMLAREMDLPPDFLPGDTLCGRCGVQACTAPETIEVDPLCWDCTVEINNIDVEDDDRDAY